MTTPPPRLVVFDAIETTFSLEPLRDQFTKAGAAPSSLETWFACLLRDAFALTAAGGYAPFRELAQGALETVLADEGIAPSGHVTDHVLDALSALPAHDDARPAMEHAADRGTPVAVLTNGTRDTTQQLLERNGLADLVSDVVTVHDAHRWKPAPEPYHLVSARAGLEPYEAALVTVHGWDICGARHAGLRTGWCSRLEHHLSRPLGPADIEGDTLVDVVAALLSR